MLPRRLDILGRVWTTRARRLPDAYGQCDYEQNRLEYRPGLSHAEKRDVVLHEIMHALRHQQGHEYGGEVEESYVRSLASGLISVFDANPKLVAWLTSKEPK